MDEATDGIGEGLQEVEGFEEEEVAEVGTGVLGEGGGDACFEECLVEAVEGQRAVVRSRCIGVDGGFSGLCTEVIGDAKVEFVGGDAFEADGGCLCDTEGEDRAGLMGLDELVKALAEALLLDGEDGADEGGDGGMLLGLFDEGLRGVGVVGSEGGKAGEEDGAYGHRSCRV